MEKTIYIPVYIYGDVEPTNLGAEKTFTKAVEVLVEKSIEEGDINESGRYVIVSKPGQLPYLESISVAEIKDAARRLIKRGKITAEDAGEEEEGK